MAEDRIVAEFTIREVESDGMCRVQYIGSYNYLLEGNKYPHNQWGHPYYSKILANALDIIARDREGDKV